MSEDREADAEADEDGGGGDGGGIALAMELRKYGDTELQTHGVWTYGSKELRTNGYLFIWRTKNLLIQLRKKLSRRKRRLAYSKVR